MIGFSGLALLSIAATALAGPSQTQCTPPAITQAGCEYVRLDCPGGPFEHVEVAAQHNVQACYAYAASQLLQGSLNAYSPHAQAPALDPIEGALSTRMSKHPDLSQLGFGSQERVLIHLFSRGYACKKHSQFEVRALTPEELESYKAIEKMNPDQPWEKNPLNALLNPLGEKLGYPFTIPPLQTRVTAFQFSNGFSATVLSTEDEGLVFTDSCAGGMDLSYYSDFRKLFDQTMKIQRDTYYSSSFLPTYQRFYSDCVHPEQQVALPKDLSVFYDNKRKSFKTKLHSTLSHGIPVGVGFCLDLWEKGEKFTQCSPESPLHDAVAIGRRTVVKNGKPRCEILLRNSWGKDFCHEFPSDITCENDSGTVWVDESRLLKAMADITVIQKK